MGNVLNFLNRKVRKLDPKFMEMLEDLKHTVEKAQLKPDLIIVGDHRPIKVPKLMTGRYENWAVGFRIRMRGMFRVKEILIKIEGYKWDELPDIQKDIFFYSIMEILLDKEAYDPELRMYDEGKTIQITQKFLPFSEEKI